MTMKIIKMNKELKDVIKVLENLPKDIEKVTVRPYVFRDLLHQNDDSYMSDKEINYKTKRGKTINITASDKHFDDIEFGQENELLGKLKEHPAWEYIKEEVKIK